jgi:hypothetical protein
MPKSKARRYVVYPSNCWPWQPRPDTGVTIREEPAIRGRGMALVIDARQFPLKRDGDGEGVGTEEDK